METAPIAWLRSSYLETARAYLRVHLAQLLSYLRAARLPVGLLINFNVGRLKDGIFRRVNSRADIVPPDSVSPSVASATSAFKKMRLSL